MQNSNNSIHGMGALGAATQPSIMAQDVSRSDCLMCWTCFFKVS